MPIYEYMCSGCGQRFELRRSFNDSDNDIACVKCGALNPRRVFSSFGVSSAGSGADAAALGSMSPGASCQIHHSGSG